MLANSFQWDIAYGSKWMVGLTILFLVSDSSLSSTPLFSFTSHGSISEARFDTYGRVEPRATLADHLHRAIEFLKHSAPKHSRKSTTRVRANRYSYFVFRVHSFHLSTRVINCKHTSSSIASFLPFIDTGCSHSSRHEKVHKKSTSSNQKRERGPPPK